MTQGQLHLRVPSETIDRIDRWRSARTCPPSRAAAVRFLLGYALDQLERPEP